MKVYEIIGAMEDTLDIFLESEGAESDKENYDYVMEFLKFYHKLLQKFVNSLRQILKISYLPLLLYNIFLILPDSFLN